jgi:hypothetical protein
MMGASVMLLIPKNDGAYKSEDKFIKKARRSAWL